MTDLRLDDRAAIADQMYRYARATDWLDTDNQRSGMLPFVFEDGFGFERYVDWALDVPLYFVKRGDHYHDVAGASFRELLEGRLPQLPGERLPDLVERPDRLQRGVRAAFP